MAVNKVIYGDDTLIDLSSDTVTADTLAEGETAHDASGNEIVGTMSGGGGGSSDIYGDTFISNGRSASSKVGTNSIAYGTDVKATGDYSSAYGTSTSAISINSHAEGSGSTASGTTSHAEGSGSTASGTTSHAEGNGSTASGQYSHSEGSNTTASGQYSHAEGNGSAANAVGSHAEGMGTTVLASGIGAHVEGTSTKASGVYSHAEGAGTTASGAQSHVEGAGSTASGAVSHAEGGSCKATGSTSHAEGGATTASGMASHSEGMGTKATGDGQHVQGKYNVEDSTKAHIVGGGSSDTDTKNIHTLDWDGNAYFAGEVESKNIPKVPTDTPGDYILTSSVSDDETPVVEYSWEKKESNNGVGSSNSEDSIVGSDTYWEMPQLSSNYQVIDGVEYTVSVDSVHESSYGFHVFDKSNNDLLNDVWHSSYSPTLNSHWLKLSISKDVKISHIVLHNRTFSGSAANLKVNPASFDVSGIDSDGNVTLIDSCVCENLGSLGSNEFLLDNNNFYSEYLFSFKEQDYLESGKAYISVGELELSGKIKTSSGGGSTYTAGDGIDISDDNVISLDSEYVPFKLAIDENGNYGYIKNDTGEFVAFNS